VAKIQAPCSGDHLAIDVRAPEDLRADQGTRNLARVLATPDGHELGADAVSIGRRKQGDAVDLVVTGETYG
jgi:hypothetical protein